MGGYIVNFTVYTLAMSGLICFALFIYKKVMTGEFNKTSSEKQLSIEETMSINPRKSLMIVKAGDERFLIASDIDKTTLISKLGQTTTHTAQNEIMSKQDLSFNNLIKNEKSDLEEEHLKKQKTLQPEKQSVHLEVITQKNPAASGLKRNSYTSRNYSKDKKVTLEVGKLENHGFSTIKEMATKINEM